LAELAAKAEQRMMKQNRDQINSAQQPAVALQWKSKPMPAKTVKQKPAENKGPTGPLATYINSTLKTRRNLEGSLRAVGIRKSPYEFVKAMIIYAAAVALAITLVLLVLLNHFGVPLILAPVLGLAVYIATFNRFLLFPSQRSRVIGKLVERDILFAARDIVIGMRSGMPLFNAITAVSTGFGETSKEFGKIVELVQLGMPIEDAMEEISEKSESKTFKRLMLQASVSMKAGVDVTSALQDVVDEVTQERIIDLRKYGQKLNALAMFYMLFGVIFPSMGIAVATIMSTFINIFPVTYVVLILALVFIAFIQLVLLNIMRTSRPIFSM
jgi:flagellar protein FlaJ